MRRISAYSAEDYFPEVVSKFLEGMSLAKRRKP
jgi:hypothetical protein